MRRAGRKLLLPRRNPTNPPLRPRLQVRLQHVQEIDAVLVAAHDLGNGATTTDPRGLQVEGKATPKL